MTIPPNHLANHPERKRVHDIVVAALGRGPDWVVPRKWNHILEVGECGAKIKMRAGGEVWLQCERIGDDGHIPFLVRGTGNADRSGTIHFDNLGAWLRVQDRKS